ncbi:MAG: prepilin-type N-terminal cleavage/methylation domain-containing protein [Planctomycetota bacterium]
MRSDQRRGFTLLELLLAIGVLLLIAALVAPPMRGYAQRVAFDQGLDDVRWMASRARMEARRLGDPVELVAIQEAGSSDWCLRVRRSHDESLQLIQEISISVSIETALADETAFASIDEEPDEIFAETSNEPIVLASWSGDGSGRVVTAVELTDGARRSATLSIRSIDGRPIVERSIEVPETGAASTMDTPESEFPR